MYTPRCAPATTERPVPGPNSRRGRAES